VQVAEQRTPPRRPPEELCQGRQEPVAIAEDLRSATVVVASTVLSDGFIRFSLPVVERCPGFDCE